MLRDDSKIIKKRNMYLAKREILKSRFDENALPLNDKLDAHKILEHQFTEKQHVLFLKIQLLENYLKDSGQEDKDIHKNTKNESSAPHGYMDVNLVKIENGSAQQYLDVNLVTLPASENGEDLSDMGKLNKEYQAELLKLKEDFISNYKSLFGARAGAFIKGKYQKFNSEAAKSQAIDDRLSSFEREFKKYQMFDFHEINAPTLHAYLKQLKQKHAKRAKELEKLKEQAYNLNDIHGELDEEYRDTRRQLRDNLEAELDTSTELPEIVRYGDLDRVKNALKERTPLAGRLFSSKLGVPEVDKVGTFGKTPLDVACYFGHVEIVKFLLAKGANVKQKNEGGYLPLHSAALNLRANQKEIIQLLLNKGAKLEDKGIYDRTALHTAVTFNNLETVKILIDLGANVNAKEEASFGKTPLYVAAEKNNAAIVTYLLRHGANPFLSDAEGVLPLYQALMMGNEAAVGAFLDSGFTLTEEVRRDLQVRAKLNDEAAKQALNLFIKINNDLLHFMDEPSNKKTLEESDDEFENGFFGEMEKKFDEESKEEVLEKVEENLKEKAEEKVLVLEKIEEIIEEEPEVELVARRNRR